MSTSFCSGNSHTRCFCYLQLWANSTWSTKCLPPIAGISPACLLLVLENHRYIQQERMGCFVPIWLLSRRKVTWGFSGSSFNVSFQIKWLCLSSPGISPTWQIPVWSHDWPVISKAVATISLHLTNVAIIGALFCLEWQVPLLQKNTWIFIS